MSRAPLNRFLVNFHSVKLRFRIVWNEPHRRTAAAAPEVEDAVAGAERDPDSANLSAIICEQARSIRKKSCGDMDSLILKRSIAGGRTTSGYG
jgi:hypothetical protein